MHRILQAVLAGAMVVAAPLHIGSAQRPTPQPIPRATPRDAEVFSDSRAGVEGGIDLLFARPTGEFLRNVQKGWGLGGHALFPSLDGVLGLRLDGTLVVYGHKSRDVQVSTGTRTIRISEDTDNNIVTFGIGPQLMLPTGPIRPYVNVHGGFSYFYTQSHLNDLDPERFETTVTESHDWKLAYGVGGGIAFAVTNDHHSLFVNFGAQYHVNGRTTYLTEGDIHEDTTTNTFVVTPRRSDANFVTFRLGINASF